MIYVRVLAFLIGGWVVWIAVTSAVRTFVLPRGEVDLVAALVFWAVRRTFELRLHGVQAFKRRDRAMAFYAPLSLLALLPTWLVLVMAGYMSMYWAVGVPTWGLAFRESGSALLTLGTAPPDTLLQTALSFTEATIGLILVALLIAYLPTMYAAFARREANVALLAVRAGTPPSALEMIERYQRLHGLGSLHEVWRNWEVWFADIEESHTSLAALSFFRSPQPDRSWVTAAGAILDAASLVNSTLDLPHDAQADLTIRAGFLALRSIADFFGIVYDPAPRRGDPISITRAEYDAVVERLNDRGVPIKPDREQAWLDFAGWRVNYDTVLLTLADLTMAPYAPWSTDRKLQFRPLPLFKRIK